MIKNKLYQIRWIDEQENILLYKSLNKTLRRKDDFLKRSSLNSDTGTLTINNLKMDDQHIYKCLYRKDAHDQLQTSVEYEVIIKGKHNKFFYQ